MISESLVHLGEKKSGIRELFEYGLRQAAVVGKENVYDYSLGNPSVPAPEEVASIIRELLEGDSLALHGYTPAGGAKEAQQAVADDLTQRSGDTIRPENIFFTCGAAPALVAVLRALAVEDAEFVAIAPYFPEYQVFVSYNGGKFVEVPLVPLGWVEAEAVVSSVDGRASPWLAAPPFILMTSCAPSFEPPLK